jgi:hypothetical protein
VTFEAFVDGHRGRDIYTLLLQCVSERCELDRIAHRQGQVTDALPANEPEFLERALTL